MEREVKALQNVIETWITKNINTAQEAQKIAKKIYEYGLLRDETMPFQIIPTEIADSDGSLLCKIFVNMDHPVYGFFSMELVDGRCAVTCPNSYKTQYFIKSLKDCEEWIEELNSMMDKFYQLSSCASERELSVCELQLNELLEEYKANMSPFIKEINEEISINEKIAISTDTMFALAKDAQRDYSRALLLPQIWVVVNEVPPEGESIEEYINEEDTDKLFNLLTEFAQKESYFAAPTYLAQRICLQTGLKVHGMSSTENEWVSAVSSEDGDFVLPVIDISVFKID